MSEPNNQLDATCRYCGQERWLDVSGDTLFFWCVSGCPIEELLEQGRQEKAGLDPDFLTNLGFPLDHPNTA